MVAFLVLSISIPAIVYISALVSLGVWNVGQLGDTWRRVVSVFCFAMALFFVVQALGLLYIESIADAMANPNDRVRIPLSVRFVGFAADTLFEEGILDVRLDPDGSNWPSGFRVFFVVLVCGLAGTCIALIQLGAGVLKHQKQWTAQGQGVLTGSCIAILVSLFFLALV